MTTPPKAAEAWDRAMAEYVAASENDPLIDQAIAHWKTIPVGDMGPLIERFDGATSPTSCVTSLERSA